MNAPPPGPRRALWLLLLLAAGIAADQATKALAVQTLQYGVLHVYLGDLLRVQLVHNEGAFLSLGNALPPAARDLVFRGGVALLLAAMSVYALRARTLSSGMLLAFGLSIAGGASNLIDRFTNDGGVIDFLNVGLGPVRTGIFNLADMYIMVGVGLLLLGEVRELRGQRHEPPAPG